MRSAATAEVTGVEQPKATRARSAAKPRARSRPRPKASVAPEPARNRRNRALVGVLGVALAAGAVPLALLLRGDQTTPASAAEAALVTPAELTAGEGPVYWAGDRPGRRLELSTTRDGTFVRYLLPGEPAGGSGTTLTVATYPLPGAYATALSRSRAEGMTSRRLGEDGLAVWNEARPTNVYLVFRGVGHLVEVYAPTGDEALAVALSGDVRPAG